MDSPYVEKSPIRPTVSLIYGSANQFVEDIDTFIKREGLQTERITTGSFKRIIKDLSEEELSLNTKYAIFFFVSDIEEFDKDNKVLYKPLSNLLIALGWFYKKFEQEKLLFLKDPKVTLPPCIEELKFISLDNISEAKEEIREHFKFEHEDKILIQSTENKYLLFSALFIVTFFIATLILFYYLDK